jgi:hypothetical protein
MGVVVGGKNAWRVKRKGDIVVAFHWVNGEPAMVLFPARPNTLGATACVVAISAAFKYAEKTGYPTRYCIEQSAKFAAMMGMYTDRFTIHRIADAILEGIDDLLDMPPEPQAFHKRKGRIIGEMSFTSDGKKVAELPVEDLTEPEMSIEVPGMTIH